MQGTARPDDVARPAQKNVRCNVLCFARHRLRHVKSGPCPSSWKTRRGAPRRVFHDEGQGPLLTWRNRCRAKHSTLHLTFFCAGRATSSGRAVPCMKVALFVPCYVDAFFPEVGIATLELLERLGCEVDFPLEQTCCGQPMANSGCQSDAKGAEALFARNFAGYDHIVTPSGSCAHHVRDQMTAIEQTPTVQAVRRNTRELVEFLHDVLEVREFPWAEFPHKVGLHLSLIHI